MSTVEEIEAAIQQLPPDQMAAFRAWFAEFDATAWDQQIAADEAAGRLDWLVQEALDDLDSAQWQTYVVAVGIRLLCLFIFLSNVSLISPA